MKVSVMLMVEMEEVVRVVAWKGVADPQDGDVWVVYMAHF